MLWAAGQPLMAVIAAAILPVLSALAAAWVVVAPVVRIVANARNRRPDRLIEEKRVDAKRDVVARRKDAEALIAAGRAELEKRILLEADLARQIRETEPGQAMAQFIRMRRAVPPIRVGWGSSRRPATTSSS